MNAKLLLDGFVIALSLEEFRSQELEKLEKIAMALGAKMTSKLPKEASCLLIRYVGGEYYQQAIEMKIPILKTTWLYDCYQQKRYLSYDKYIAPIFYGCQITTTGFQLNDRLQMKQMIVNYGGQFADELIEKETTHLICQEAKGNKYNHAKKWKEVFIVRKEWIVDCIKANHWIPEKAYNVQEGNTSTNASNINNNIHNNINNTSECNESTKKHSLHLSESSFLTIDTNPDNNNYDNTNNTSQNHSNKIVIPSTTKRKKTNHESITFDPFNPMNNPIQIEQYILKNTTIHDFPSYQMIEIEKQDMFLGHSFYITGYTNDVREYITQCILHVGGYISWFLEYPLSYVVLGPHSTPKEHQQMVDYCAQQIISYEYINIIWLLEHIFDSQIIETILQTIQNKQQTQSQLTIIH